MDSGLAFLTRSRDYLTGDYLPRIRAAVEALDEADLWWRPNPASNAIGNLLLHLAGNLRQWIVSGVGGAPDRRERAGEFAAQGEFTRAELLDRLTEAVLDADAVLARTDPASLGERRPIQGRDVTVMEAIYHVVEHFAMHAGQIFYVAKLRTGRDLGFYRLEGGIPRETWPGRSGSDSPQGARGA
jgi:uncharacterized damage-inducible protein DinB